MSHDHSDISAAGLAGTFASLRPEILRFLSVRCGDASDAEDLLQDLWIRLAALKTGPIANPRGYLFRMANNMALNQSRSRRRAMSRDRSWIGEQGGEVTNIEERPDPEPSAHETISRRQEAEILHRAIQELPPGAQRALRLHRFDGHDQLEVARIMGISLSGVEKHLASAMKRLRDTLEDCGWFAPAVSVKKQANGGRESLTEDRQ